MKNGIVIVGTGQAGFQAAASLRTEGYQEKITLIGDEPHIPYQRPPLSKGFPLGKQDLESIDLRPKQFYQDHQIDLIASEKVTAIDRAAKQVSLKSGGYFPYEGLVLAVGARNRTLSLKGAKVVCGASISEIEGTGGKVQEVLLSDGTRCPADLVLMGVGVLPNIELARNAGLCFANGIAVNEYLQTDDENIFAIGDCAEHPCEFAGARVRLESVQNAADHAQCVAATIAGRRNVYRALPWFWTDQFDIKLQMAGLSNGHDRFVLRGNSESRKLSVFYFKEGRLVAIDSINRPLDHMMGRKLIANRVQLTPEQAADESVDLKKMASSSGAAHS